MDIFPFFD